MAVDNGIEREELLDAIKDEPSIDIKDDFGDFSDIPDSDVRESCDESNTNHVTNSSKIAQKTRNRKRSMSPGESTPKKFKTDSHTVLLSEYFDMNCDMCGLLLSSYRDTNKHYKDVHNLKGYLTCCSKKFFRLQHMLSHCEWHMNPEGFK